MPLPDQPAADVSGRRTAAAIAAILATAILAYANTLEAPLLLDDYGAIVDNHTIRRLWPLSQVLQAPSNVGTAGRPAANFSLALNYALGGTEVRGYHVTNLIIHALAGLALFGVLRRTFQRRDDERLAKHAILLAGLIAALWTAHPLHPASVTYVSQRTEILMGLCYLFTLYGFIRGEERRGWLVASVIACVLGAACKEVIVTAPVLVLLYDRTFVTGSFRQALRRRPYYYAGLLVSWLVIAWSLRAGLDDRKVGYASGVSAWHFLLTQSEAIVTYLRLVVWPHPLIFDYGPLFQSSLSAAAPWIALLATFVVLSVTALRRSWQLAFCSLAFLVLLAPTSSVVPIALQPIAENRAYLPSAAALTLFVVGLLSFLGPRAIILAVIAAGAFAVMTFQRNALFAHPLSLAVDNIAKRPLNPRAYDTYAQQLKAAGRVAEAIPYLQRALELNPASPISHAMLADCHLETGRVDAAAASYLRALQLNPRLLSARNNYGLIHFRAGRLEDAAAQFGIAVQLAPASVLAQRNLALSLMHLGRAPQAEAHFRSALQLQPGDASIHYDYGELLARTENWPAAAEQFSAALRLRPDWAEAHHDLGVALYHLERRTEAAAQIERALQLKPDYEQARGNLARLRAERPAAR